MQIDEIAEHILSLGYQPLGTMQDFIKNSEIQDGFCADYQNSLSKGGKSKELSISFLIINNFLP